MRTDPSTDPAAKLVPLVEIRPSERWLEFGFKELWNFRELAYFLVWRELKVRYKQASIGAAWAIIQPLTALLIFTAIFGYFARLPSDGIPYPLFFISGLLPWTYFSEAFRRAALGLVDDSELIRKVYFPRLVIPLAGVSSPLLDLAIASSLLVPLMLWFGKTPTIAVLLLPAFVLQAMLLALASGLWLGPVNVRFRDVKHTLPLILQIGMFASPVVYPYSMIPPEWQALYSLNPMVGVINGFRWCLFGGPSPDLTAILIGILVTGLLLITGLAYFRRMERSFADVI